MEANLPENKLAETLYPWLLPNVLLSPASAWTETQDPAVASEDNFGEIIQTALREERGKRVGRRGGERRTEEVEGGEGGVGFGTFQAVVDNVTAAYYD